MTIKTFRGKLEDGEQQKIRLSTKKGKIGYGIIKLELIYFDPAGDTAECTIKIFKVSQTSITNTIDFSDGNLLAAGYMEATSDPGYNIAQTIIFDREVFNQDIYITSKEGQSATEGVNYYLELEVMSLTDNAAAVSTLRDIRLNPQVGE